MAAINLCDRAFEFVSERESATDAEVLRHVYGGSPPSSLYAKLAEPLLADKRLSRDAEGRWAIYRRAASRGAFTALALVATGPTPGRARVVRVSALHVADRHVEGHFDATVNPERRVPRYVAERVGVEAETIETQPTFAAILDDLAGFLGDRPVLAQDARLTWAFLDAEARRFGHILAAPTLVDLNEIAAQQLELAGKPSLSLVAALLGIGSVRIEQPDEEARVLGLVGGQLLAGLTDDLEAASSNASPAARPLQRASTARALPDVPGVYVMRDKEQLPLYVGKARRLRTRVAAYVHRPLGATRRLEGLVGAVDAVDSTQCETDLEALILEDREIRRLQPRFNTVRQQRPPRYWIRLPAPAGLSARGRPLAPPRLELSDGTSDDGGDLVGPYRNEALAEQARQLARAVFDLDRLRRADRRRYAERLAQAWGFLHGDESETAETLARAHSVALLRKVLPFDARAALLPADPRRARYVVVRPAPSGIEGLRLDAAVLQAWTILEDEYDTHAFARRLLDADAPPRTSAEDADVVLRWFGAQRPPARLIWLADDELAAADSIEQAALNLLELRAWEA